MYVQIQFIHPRGNNDDNNDHDAREKECASGLHVIFLRGNLWYVSGGLTAHVPKVAPEEYVTNKYILKFIRINCLLLLMWTHPGTH